MDNVHKPQKLLITFFKISYSTSSFTCLSLLKLFFMKKKKKCVFYKK